MVSSSLLYAHVFGAFNPNARILGLVNLSYILDLHDLDYAINEECIKLLPSLVIYPFQNRSSSLSDNFMLVDFEERCGKTAAGLSPLFVINLSEI